MKKLSPAIFYLLLTCLTGCLSSRSDTAERIIPAGSGTTLIRVEYRNERTVVQEIVQVLRSSRIADLDIPADARPDDVLEVRYRTLTVYKLQYLKQQLEQLAGVLNVQVIKDGLPTKNPFL